MNMYYAYARVSTDKQLSDRQEVAINKYIEENEIILKDFVIEHFSGKSFKRPLYQQLRDKLVKGDTLIVKEVDRLGRDWEGIKEECKYFSDNGINLVIIDTSLLNIIHHEDKQVTLEDKLVHNQVLELYCYMAQKEREKLSQRTIEGLKAAQKRGVVLGKPKDELREAKVKMYLEKGYGLTQIARELDCAISTVQSIRDRILKNGK